MKNIRAVIPAAGVGTRLRPHTYTIPKVLLNVAGKPIIAHILDSLIAEGIEKATFIIGYLGELVEEYVKENYKIQADFIYQEETKGLGHAIYLAAPTFGDDDIFIVLGDTIFDMDLKEILSSKYSSLGVKTVIDPRRFGVAEVINGFISDLIEKPSEPKSNLALVGVYFIKNHELLTKGLNYIVESDTKTRGEYQLTDALEWMIRNGELFTPFNVENWYDCGTAETLLSTNRFLLERLYSSDNKPEINAGDNLIIPPVYISKSSKITGSIIGPFATISESTEIKNSIIKNSIISDGAKVENIILNSSLIGNNSTIIGRISKLNVGDSTILEID